MLVAGRTTITAQRRGSADFDGKSSGDLNLLQHATSRLLAFHEIRRSTVG